MAPRPTFEPAAAAGKKCFACAAAELAAPFYKRMRMRARTLSPRYGRPIFRALPRFCAIAPGTVLFLFIWRSLRCPEGPLPERSNGIVISSGSGTAACLRRVCNRWVRRLQAQNVAQGCRPSVCATLPLRSSCTKAVSSQRVLLPLSGIGKSRCTVTTPSFSAMGPIQVRATCA